MTVGGWLKTAARRLQTAGVSSPKLDAEIILADILKKDRAWLIAHADTALQEKVYKKAETLLARRKSHEPLAYIRGFKEFYGRNFSVSKDVLVPRPESEALVELAKNCPLGAGDTILDVGTGSGNLGIALKLELPDTNVTLIDASQAALDIAGKNAEQLGAAVDLQLQDIFALERTTKLIGAPYKLIVANLPYVDDLWDRSRATDFEPSLAIFSPQHGLWHYLNLLSATPLFLAESGWLIVEADPRQQDELIHYATKFGFELAARDGFALLFTIVPKQPESGVRRFRG